MDLLVWAGIARRVGGAFLRGKRHSCAVAPWERGRPARPASRRLMRPRLLCIGPAVGRAGRPRSQGVLLTQPGIAAEGKHDGVAGARGNADDRLRSILLYANGVAPRLRTVGLRPLW